MEVGIWGSGLRFGDGGAGEVFGVPPPSPLWRQAAAVAGLWVVHPETELGHLSSVALFISLACHEVWNPVDVACIANQPHFHFGLAIPLIHAEKKINPLPALHPLGCMRC